MVLSLLKLLFSSPYEFAKHPKMISFWGKDLPHVVKEIYKIPYAIAIGKGEHNRKNLSLYQWIRLIIAIRRYLKKMPYEYVWNKTTFLNREFLISRAVLIPRPETEELVGRIIKEVKNKFSLIKINSTNSLKIIDIGSGSGIIAICLQSEFPEAEVSAIDISYQALQVSRKNAIRILKKESKNQIHFFYGDIFAIPLKKILPYRGENQVKFDMVISNPPYIGIGEKEFLSSSVIQYEPYQALFGGEDGLDFYRSLAKLLPAILRPQGKLYLEVGWQQSEKVKNLFKYMRKKEILKDMFGKKRFLMGEL